MNKKYLVRLSKKERDELLHVVKKRKGSSLKKYEGIAWIQPWGKGRSLVTYQMLAEPKVVAPHGVLISGLRKAAAGVIKAVRDRVAMRTASR